MVTDKKEKEEKKDNNAMEQAKAQLSSVTRLVKAFIDAVEAEDDDARDKAEQAIQEDALDVSVRSDWSSDSQKLEAAEYRILLCTGGPAVQIVGELDEYKQPISARIQYQDWFTQWTDLLTDTEEDGALLEYAERFYFGQ